MKTLNLSEDNLRTIRVALEGYLKELRQRYGKTALGNSLKQYYSREELNISDLQAKIKEAEIQRS
jgi:hypothetical protein